MQVMPEKKLSNKVMKRAMINTFAMASAMKDMIRIDTIKLRVYRVLTIVLIAIIVFLSYKLNV